MILCEIILISVSCGTVVLLLGLGYAFKRLVDDLTTQINTLTLEIANQTEKIKKIQLKVLSLNEISGLNSI